MPKKIYFFSSQCIRITGNSIDFDNKKIKISNFYENKNKKILNIDGIDDMVKIIHLNTLLDITIMILFNHYL